MGNTVVRKDLIDSLTIFKNAFDANALIRLKIQDNNCKLLMSDKIMSLNMEWPLDSQADTVHPLDIAIDQFLGFLKSGVGTTLGLEFKDKHILTLDNAKLRISNLTSPIQEFKSVVDNSPVLGLKSSSLFSSIANGISPFIVGSHHNTLNGAKIYSDGTKLQIYGTDGFRIASVLIDESLLEQKCKINCVIPYSVLTTFEKLGKSLDRCIITFDDNLIRFNTSVGKMKLELTACQSKVNYPNIDHLINYSPGFIWEINLGEFIKYINMHKIVNEEKNPAIQLNFTDDKLTLDNLQLADNSSMINTSIDNISLVQGQASQNKSVKLSIKFLLESLNFLRIRDIEIVRFGLDSQKNLVWLKDNGCQNNLQMVAIIAPIE